MKTSLFVLLLTAACAQRPPPDGAAGPAEAVQDFASALQRGDSASAWALLSSRAQTAANTLSKASQPDGGADGRAMLFGSALPGGPVTVARVQQSGDSAEVQTAGPDGGAAQSFRAVRENGRWRVDLDVGR